MLDRDERRCDRCRRPIDADEGRRFADPDDWFVPDQLGLDPPCTLCDDCVAEAAGSMTDDEREFFDVD